MGGPVWDSTAQYNLHDIVEWPDGSGHLQKHTTAGPTGEPNSTGKWTGPCSCEEIAEVSGIVWDSTVAYNPWQILEYNGGIWFAQDAGTSAGDIPEEGSGLWILCKASPLALALTLLFGIVQLFVTEGEVYQYLQFWALTLLEQVLQVKQ